MSSLADGLSIIIDRDNQRFGLLAMIDDRPGGKRAGENQTRAVSGRAARR